MIVVGRLQGLAGRLVGLGLQVGAADAAFEEAGEDGLDDAAEDDLGASVAVWSVCGDDCGMVDGVVFTGSAGEPST